MEVTRREIYRYLGFKNIEPDQTTKTLVENAVAELQEEATTRFAFRRAEILKLQDDIIEFPFMTVTSKNLAKNLKDCKEAYFIAVTLGQKVDILINRYLKTDMAKAVVMQAASAAMVEDYCNEQNNMLKQECLKSSLFVHPRFSPGYGDLSLSCQQPILSFLEAQKTVGIVLTDNYQMIPSKSITAIIGISEKPLNCPVTDCELCDRQCEFRRE